MLRLKLPITITTNHKKSPHHYTSKHGGHKRDSMGGSTFLFFIMVIRECLICNTYIFFKPAAIHLLDLRR